MSESLVSDWIFESLGIEWVVPLEPVECTVKSVMVNLGQQVLEVLSLGNTNREYDQFRLVLRTRQLSHYMLNWERKVNYAAFFSKLASWQDYHQDILLKKATILYLFWF